MVDVAVCGAGVFGAWTALSLRRRGRSVVMVDPFGAGHARSSSGGESRIIRMGYGGSELYTRWAWRSLHLWRSFFDEIGRRDLLRETGVLWSGGNAACPVLARCNIPFEILDASALARRYPQMRFERDVTAVLEPDGGALLAGEAVRAVVRAAGVSVRRSLDGIHARQTVYACGAWLPRLFPELLAGVIRPTRQCVFFFGTPAGCEAFGPERLPVWIDASEAKMPYGFPDLDGQGLKVAFHHLGPEWDPERGERLVAAGDVEAARDYVERRFPSLAGAPLVEAKVCSYENTGSGDFLIDRHPERDDVWMVGGGSGHGFKHGPAVGEYVAGLLCGDAPAVECFTLPWHTQARARAVM